MFDWFVGLWDRLFTVEHKPFESDNVDLCNVSDETRRKWYDDEDDPELEEV